MSKSKIFLLGLSLMLFIFNSYSCEKHEYDNNCDSFIIEDSCYSDNTRDSLSINNDTIHHHGNNQNGDNSTNNNHFSLTKNGVRIGTYNVGHFNDGKLGGYQGEDVLSYMQKWKKWIQEQKLDILSLNEWSLYFDKSNTVNATDSLLAPFYKNIYFGIRDAWIYNGICTNYEVDEHSHKQIKWNKTNYYAIFEDVFIEDKRVTIIATHLPWQATHQKAMEELIEELKQYEYFICFGDMNATDEEQTAFTNYGFNIANGGSYGFFKTYEGEKHIHLDNIVTSNNIEILEVISPNPNLSKGDHFPLEAVIRIKS